MHVSGNSPGPIALGICQAPFSRAMMRRQTGIDPYAAQRSIALHPHPI